MVLPKRWTRTSNFTEWRVCVRYWPARRRIASWMRCKSASWSPWKRSLAARPKPTISPCSSCVIEPPEPPPAPAPPFLPPLPPRPEGSFQAQERGAPDFDFPLLQFPQCHHHRPQRRPHRRQHPAQHSHHQQIEGDLERERQVRERLEVHRVRRVPVQRKHRKAAQNAAHNRYQQRLKQK